MCKISSVYTRLIIIMNILKLFRKMRQEVSIIGYRSTTFHNYINIKCKLKVINGYIV